MYLSMIFHVILCEYFSNERSVRVLGRDYIQYCQVINNKIKVMCKIPAQGHLKVKVREKNLIHQ